MLKTVDGAKTNGFSGTVLSSVDVDEIKVEEVADARVGLSSCPTVR